jgi:TorA maturation chaperone TorD
MQQPTDKQGWLNRATLFELLAFSFRVPTPELGEALSSGEFADALSEIGVANGIDAGMLDGATKALSSYRGTEPEPLFHALRVTYTALFVGAPEPLVSPFAGVWWALAQGIEPLLFVNKRSMDVERYLRSVGIGQPEGRNEPLDHIATMLEFLQYAALACADAVELPEGIEIGPETSERFIADFIDDWILPFTHKVVEQTDERVAEQTGTPFYRTMALMLEDVLASDSQK